MSTRQKASSMTKWTDTEKLKVLFSIIDTCKIDWETVYIPEGRSKKAVKCMLDISRQSTRNHKNGDSNGGDTASKPVKKAKAATVGTKRKRGKAQIEEGDEEVKFNPAKKSKMQEKIKSKDMSKEENTDEYKDEGNEEDADDENEGERQVKDESETDSQATLDDSSELLA